MTETPLKPKKWPKYLWNLNTDRNTLETLKNDQNTFQNLKKGPKYPQNIENDQNSPYA